MEAEKRRSRAKKEVSFLGLFGKEFLEDTQDKLRDATGMLFAVIDYKGTVVAGTSETEKVCGRRKKPGSRCEECQMVRAFAAAKSAIKNCPYLFACPEGFAHMAIPVVVNNQYLGAVIGGPVRCDEVALADVAAEKKAASGEQAVRESAERESAWIPEYSAKRLQSLADMVFLLFREMGEKETIAMQMGAIEHREVHLADLRKKNREMEEQIAKLEYAALKSQLPNQIILNMLTTISSFSILENAERTENLIAGLSGILRYYLDDTKDVIALSEELQQVSGYLDIVKQQYKNRLDFKISCQKEVENQKIPVLLLLPIVEHMVDFGIVAGQFQGMLYIDAERKKEMCKITVQMENSGPTVGYLENAIADGNFLSMQTENLRKRLQRKYAENFEMRLTPQVAVFELPLEG